MNGGYRYGCYNKNKIETRYTAIRKDRKPIGYKVDLCNISNTNLVTESGVKISLLQIYSHNRVSIFLILFIRNCRRNITRLWLSFNYSKTPIYLALIYRVPIYWVPLFTGPDYFPLRGPVNQDFTFLCNTKFQTLRLWTQLKSGQQNFVTLWMERQMKIFRSGGGKYSIVMNMVYKYPSTLTF